MVCNNGVQMGFKFECDLNFNLNVNFRKWFGKTFDQPFFS